MDVSNSQTLIHRYFASTTQPKAQCEPNNNSDSERAPHLREADEAALLAESHWQLYRTLSDDGGGDDEGESSNDSGDSFQNIWDILDKIETLARCTKVDSTHKRGDLALKLRVILKKWRADKLDRAPRKLLYLLDGTYPKDELRASSLKGTDIHKVALFRTLADQVGLRVGLVAIEELCWGVVYESEGFECEGEEASSVTRFVDMNGKHISDTLEHYEEATFPDCDTLRDNVSDGPYMEEEIDSVGRDSAVPHRVVTRLAQRAALVIWPVYEDFSVLYTGKDAIKKAAADVQSISSRHASLIEDDLVQLLLSRALQSPKLIVQAVCRVALRWRRLPLWNRAIEKCCQDSVAILSPKQVFDAIQCFGLESVQRE
ncbi:hypothetical protein BC629DRAFT_1592608 [Irpex lacteus]|nr:hypothetical protein BC629DRAFT_1592608 [Irpex lacteus]